MHEKVREYLDVKRREDVSEENKSKKQLLMALGLYEKVYSPDGIRNEEYYMSEWDESKKQYQYYKHEIIPVSDEEYEEIKKYAKPTVENKKPDDSNGFAKFLNIIAFVLFFAGYFVGMVALTEEVVLGLAIWSGVTVAGAMILGFAQIITLLTAIKNK